MGDAILEMLAEEGMSNDAELGSLLFAMRSEATSVRPMPSAAVAAFMPARRVHGRRGAFTGRRRIVTGLIVLGSLGLGVGAAAASPDVRSATQPFAQTVMGAIGSGDAPSAPIPAPHRPAGAPHLSGKGAATHLRPAHHPGSSNGHANGSHAPGSGAPTTAPGKGNGSEHPSPSPSEQGKHRP